MLDNIILRLHGCNQPRKDTQNFNALQKGFGDMIVSSHFELFKRIMSFKGKSFTINRIHQKETLETSLMSEDEFLINNTSKQLNNHYLLLNKSTFVSDKEVKERNLKINGKYRVPSSGHDVVYSVNIDGGFVELNVNIPKYLYGHNLAQFIPQVDSGVFTPWNGRGNANSWLDQKKYLHQRLLKFIDEFLMDLFYFFELEELPNYDYIELNRIDLCYNQFFKSKTDALMYLEAQKKIHKKGTSKKSKLYSSFDTSIAYHTSDGSYFKIYHKGSEYVNTKHGDFKKHQAINKAYIEKKHKYYSDPLFKKHNEMIFQMFKNDTLGKIFEPPEEKPVRNLINDIYKDLPINTMFLRNEMDKVLRYEISLQSKALSRVFKSRVFRTRCPYHKEAKKIYSFVRRYDQRITKKGRKPTKDERDTFNKMHRFLNNGCFLLLTKNEKYHKWGRSGTMDYNPSTGIYKINPLYKQINKGTLIETRDVGFFNKNLLHLILDNFRKQINAFQIEELQPFDDLVKKVREYNRISQEKKDVYDEVNDWKTWQNGKRIIKGNKVITKASQLLTEKEKNEKHLKKINFTNISEIFRLMHENKMTPSQVRKHLNMGKSAFYRRLKLLQMLGVKEQSLSLPKKIDVKTDFSDYYYLTSGSKYKSNFFLSQSHSKLDYKRNTERITITQQKYTNLKTA